MHLGSYCEIMEHKCSISCPWCISWGLKVTMVCTSWFLVFFIFLKIINYAAICFYFKNLDEGFFLQIKCFIAMSIEFWYVGGCLCNVCGKKSKNKEKKEKLIFWKEEGQKNNSWAPPFFFSTIISSKNNSNIQIIFET